MDIDTFIKAHADELDAAMGTKSMVVSGQTFNVVWNDSQRAQEGAFGGLEGDVQAVATAQADDVSSANALLGKRCTVGGDAYRIAQVRTGSIAIHFALSDVNEPR